MESLTGCTASLHLQCGSLNSLNFFGKLRRRAVLPTHKLWPLSGAFQLLTRASVAIPNEFLHRRDDVFVALIIGIGDTSMRKWIGI